jgi:hypothetical protein
MRPVLVVYDFGQQVRPGASAQSDARAPAFP